MPRERSVRSYCQSGKELISVIGIALYILIERALQDLKILIRC